MTVWDALYSIITSLPPIVMVLILLAVLAAVIIFIAGFSKHGLNFIKYGFKQTALDRSLEKRFDELGTQINGLHTELNLIKTNHFGHLKDFLTELTSILVDKNIINNSEKTRLDNRLREM